MAGNKFMESADRLEGVVRALKTRQIEERQGPIKTAPGRLTAESPDELWAKQFSTQCIGPVCFKVAPGAEMSMPPLTQAMQSFPPMQQGAYVPSRETSKPTPRSALAPVSKNAKPQPIGAAIGKPMKRGLLSRVFSRA